MAKCTSQICKIKSQEHAVDSHNIDDNDGGDHDDEDDDALILATKIYIL